MSSITDESTVNHVGRNACGSAGCARRWISDVEMASPNAQGGTASVPPYVGCIGKSKRMLLAPRRKALVYESTVNQVGRNACGSAGCARCWISVAEMASPNAQGGTASAPPSVGWVARYFYAVVASSTPQRNRGANAPLKFLLEQTQVTPSLKRHPSDTQ